MDLPKEQKKVDLLVGQTVEQRASSMGGVSVGKSAAMKVVETVR